MVGTGVIAAVICTLCISLFLPFAAIIVWSFRNKRSGVWKAWLLGAAGFFVMQSIIRINILNILATTEGYQNFVKHNYILYCFILALTAALVEVIGRYVTARILKKDLTCVKGIAAGLGHGGIESVFLIGLTYINNLIYIWLINAGKFDSVVKQTEALGADTKGLLAVKDGLLDSGSLNFYLAGYERILTMIIQVFLSLLVCWFVYKKKDALGIALCIVFHFMLDFVPAIVNGFGSKLLDNLLSEIATNVAVYGFLTVAALAALLGIFHIRNKWCDSDSQEFGKI